MSVVQDLFILDCMLRGCLVALIICMFFGVWQPMVFVEAQNLALMGCHVCCQILILGNGFQILLPWGDVCTLVLLERKNVGKIETSKVNSQGNLPAISAGSWVGIFVLFLRNGH